MEFSATYNTDIGIRKSTNQDSVAIRIIDSPDGQVAFAIVCDGMDNPHSPTSLHCFSVYFSKTGKE